MLSTVQVQDKSVLALEDALLTRILVTVNVGVIVSQSKNIARLIWSQISDLTACESEQRDPVQVVLLSVYIAYLNSDCIGIKSTHDGI